MASLNPNLRDFWFKDGIPSEANFRKTRHRVLYGGRASSKSWEFAGMAASIASQYRTRFLCVRRFQNKIKESVHTLIAAQISSFEMEGFAVRATDILHENGSEFVFYGIERNTDEIKSFEGADVLWIEEAHNLTKEQWEILEPTIRKEGSEVWISFNPNLITDFVYRNFVVNAPKDSIVRLINYPENPFISDTLLKVIEAKKEEDYEEYEHIYLGVPRSDDERAIIKRSHIEAAIDAHLKLPELNWTGRKTVGYDPADQGDPNALVFAYGSIVEHVEEWKAAEDQLLESTMRVLATAKRLGADQIGYDGIGVGVGVGSILNDKKYRNHYKFMAGGKVANPDKHYEGSHRVLNKDFFANLKAQAWWILADRFRNTYNAVRHGHIFEPSQMISISSKIPDRLRIKLIDELATPLRDEDNTGKVKVESKKDLAKRGIESHNLADALVIAVSRDMLARRSLLDVL